jgi:hypothetical protein
MLHHDASSRLPEANRLLIILCSPGAPETQLDNNRLLAVDSLVIMGPPKFYRRRMAAGVY